jgi:type I restriction enzyme S subunit
VRAFVDDFGVLAKAEGGTRRLRDLILDLAVKGALVPQDEREGTAEALASRLQSAREKLAATVRSDLPPVRAEDAPHTIPASWRWVRLANFGGLLGGGTPAKSNTSFWEGPIPWVSPKDMKRPYIGDAEDHISEAAVERSAVKLIPTPSLLFVVRGMILAHSFPVALTTKQVTINQDMKALVLAVPETGEYLLRACWAARPRVLEKVERSSHGTCRLDIEAVEEVAIPLPPLAEQQRIVAKVDELMRLLDDLEAKQAAQRETQVQFRSAALDALTSAEGPGELATAWRRVADNFEVLFERAGSVPELRRAVLEVAVRGRLGRQNNDDEPVSILLQRIQKERAGLLEGRRLGGRGHNGERDREPEPYAIPTGWQWCRLMDVAGHIVDGTHHTPRYQESGVAFISAKDIQGGSVCFGGCRYVTQSEFDELAKRCRPQRGNVLVTKSGSIGEVAVVDSDRPFTLFESVALIPLVPSVDSQFAAYVIYLGASGAFGRENQKGVAVRHLHLVDLRRLPFPLPPLPEQRRIVAKVEHLMKLCDDLEATLRQADETAGKLVEAVVGELIAA